MVERLKDVGWGIVMVFASPFMFAWMLWDAGRRERAQKKREREEQQPPAKS